MLFKNVFDFDEKIKVFDERTKIVDERIKMRYLYFYIFHPKWKIITTFVV